jgi:DNA-binding YbaB/EbfC family protein
MSKNPFGNMADMMKQAQAMQERLGKIQEEAETKSVEASAGGGMVTITANGGMKITKIVIDPEVLKSEDPEMLQDLLVAATNEALRKAKELMAQEVKGLTGGMGIPGMF